MPSGPYAENTWVPVITSAGTIPTYTTNSGTYTRIGRLVFFNISLSGDGGTAGSGANQITITLPFTTSASQLKLRIPCGTAVNGANEHVIFLELAAGANATALLFKDSVVGSDLEQVTFDCADQSNATRFINIQGKILV